MKRGIATFTLDWGKCPKWLFDKMVRLGREITYVLVEEFGPEEYIKRMADPVWFQTLGTVLAFDWNASGLTTTLTAALKEAIRGHENELGIYIAGGKGKTSRKTPEQIENWGQIIGFSQETTQKLVYNSKMSAKVDSSLVQDGYQIYHHTFFFSRSGSWTVVQQGMNIKNQSARRYHWHSDDIKDMIVEPHTAISSQKLNVETLNLTSKDSEQNRCLSLELARDKKQVFKDIEVIRKYSSHLVKTLAIRNGNNELVKTEIARKEFKHHPVELENFFESPYLYKILGKITLEDKPSSYEELVSLEGVGPKTIRALSLVSEVIYGAEASYLDPARYSFAHGGKDGTPFFVDKKTYKNTIIIMKKAIQRSKLDYRDKNKALSKVRGLELKL